MSPDLSEPLHNLKYKLEKGCEHIVMGSQEKPQRELAITEFIPPWLHLPAFPQTCSVVSPQALVELFTTS